MDPDLMCPARVNFGLHDAAGSRTNSSPRFLASNRRIDGDHVVDRSSHTREIRLAELAAGKQTRQIRSSLARPGEHDDAARARVGPVHQVDGFKLRSEKLLERSHFAVARRLGRHTGGFVDRYKTVSQFQDLEFWLIVDDNH